MPSSFRKALVANRGEIAVRVIRTLREMGIRSVAVYSEADRAALHVRMADEAWPIGPAPSAESYLSIERVLDACKKSGAEAVHPGYGFLSENASFAEACEDAGLTFIGPSAAAIRAMGDKVSARERMLAAGVTVVPGATVQTIAELEARAEELGYPILIKASAGGGGKGMRFVENVEGLRAGYERARSEALSSFGSDVVYLEKAIVRPRHVEIQVLRDQHGEGAHLFERDCSIQRRHQKIIEETPCPSSFVTPELVERMGAAALEAARAVDYHSAGTIEFLLDQSGNFYFLEMNTRLQVEHPITELVTGFDLVREQVRIAQGEHLERKQREIVRTGHAIECRIYAEDPAAGFLPSPGRIDVLRTPSGPGVRDDSGVYEGAEISSYYDPLVSKLCVWAPTRDRAIARMQRALHEYVITGIRTNLAFHAGVMRHARFQSGDYDTGFAPEHHTELTDERLDTNTTTALTIGAALIQAQRDSAAATREHAPTDTAISRWRSSLR